MNIDFLGTQDSAYFFLKVPSNLTPEGTIAYILNSILNNIRGIVTDENNYAILDENGNPVSYDNSKLYPDMRLKFWRTRINGSWYEYQLVFIMKELIK